MTQKEKKEIFDRIMEALQDAGLDPYAQLYGYCKTGNEMYITRNGNARELIRALEEQDITKYLESLQK